MFAFTSTPTTLLLRKSTFTTPPQSQNTTRLTSRFQTCRPCTTRRTAIIKSQLIGIPDHLRGSNDPSPQEVLLAELRFSDPSRLPALIESSLEHLDEEFYSFLEKKINESADLEERENLRALRDAITSIMKQMYEEISKQEKLKETQGTEQEQLQPQQSAATKSEQSFDELIDMLLESYDENDQSSLKTGVDLNYHRIDISFLERLSERIVSSGEDSPKLSKLRDVINDVMNIRVTNAMQSLREVLSSGPLESMQRTVDVLVEQARIDDAFILLLQANIQEAGKASASDVVKVLSQVLEYATEKKDASVPSEIRLIRMLLRSDDEESQNQMLTDSFTPGTPVSLPDGTDSVGTKVDGKKFVTALRKLIEEFGNIDDEFVQKLSKIGELSEAVARKIYDMEGKGVEELQDEAFHKRSVSIWDLEEFEHQETGEGRTAPWEGEMGPIPDKMGFGQDGKLSV